MENAALETSGAAFAFVGPRRGGSGVGAAGNLQCEGVIDRQLLLHARTEKGEIYAIQSELKPLKGELPKVALTPSDALAKAIPHTGNHSTLSRVDEQPEVWSGEEDLALVYRVRSEPHPTQLEPVEAYVDASTGKVIKKVPLVTRD